MKLQTLFPLILLLSLTSVSLAFASPHIDFDTRFSSANASSVPGCPPPPPSCMPWDTWCWFRYTIQLMSCGAYETFSDAVREFVYIAVALPVFNSSLAIALGLNGTFLFTSLAPAMNDLFDKALVLGYVIGGIAVMIAIVRIVAEAGGMVQQGEAMATLKRSIVFFALLPLLRYIYDLVAVGIALGNSYILGPEYVAKLGQVFTGIVKWMMSSLLGFFLGILMFIPLTLVLIVLSAIRVMVTGVLAALLPILLALVLVPISVVRNVAITLISTLVALLIAPIVTSGIVAMCSSMSGAEIGFFYPTLEGVIFLCTLIAPMIGLVITSRAGIALSITSMFVGYVTIAGAGARLAMWVTETAPVMVGATAGPRIGSVVMKRITRIVRRR